MVIDKYDHYIDKYDHYKLCPWYFHFQQDAINKPYWTLRLVSEQREMEILEVKKDTQRVDEIKAMKQAWESAEPGRAVKVIRMQSAW